MPNFLVTMLYDPGTPKSYIVEDAPDQRAARTFVRKNILGYDPGVEVEVTELPIHNKAVKYSNLGGCND